MAKRVRARKIPPVIYLRDVSLRRGPQPLIEHADLAILRGEKIGVVGRNGCGKSTLLALVAGDQADETLSSLGIDSGEFECPTSLRIVRVAQQLPDTDQPAVEYVIEGDTALARCMRRLQAAQQRADGLAEATALADYEQLGGYTARSRAAALLDGLGFDAQRIDRPLREFSGGLRMRANLARALMCPSDVLLLDEPTNHLDLDAVLWLEGWLQAYPGTLLLVSHDREFLDAIVDKIVHIHAGRVDSYSGNFSRYMEQRLARRAQREAENARRTRELEHVQGFIDRFRAKASKARQAQSRIKWLERLPALVEERDESSVNWQFVAPTKLPNPLVSLERWSAGYGTTKILQEVKLAIAPGARLGILGRNGAGKSTLIRSLAGELSALGGERIAAAELHCGFFAQLEVDQLDADSSPLLELSRRGGAFVATWSEQQKRDHLGGFGFRGERVFASVREFSGGERARLSLAILVARRPNLLLLDEPTNHLDLEMRDSLLLALQDYAGAVVLVSHDRGLLGGVCDEFVLVHDQGVQSWSGNLDDYATWLAERRGPSTKSSSQERSATSRQRRRGEADARRELAPLRTELKRIEKRLAELGEERVSIERQLADPAQYSSDLSQRFAALAAELEPLEERWLELGEQLEREPAAHFEQH